MAHCLRDTGDTHAARVGFIVSKAVGNAVVRNRTKRRLREIMRVRLGELSAGELFVVRALPPAAAASGSQLRDDLAAAVLRAREKLG